MSESRWGGPARKVEGGLRARSARGEIGSSWWSKRFLAVLESLAMGGRLARGRTYARAGQVLALDVQPGTVLATVQGSRPDPYEAEIHLAVFTDVVWQSVEQAIAAQALFSARLLAGELPAEIEDVCTAAGAPLFPQRQADLLMSCSCPDFAVPCKHLAATFYLLAEAFDDDPFRILHWRGRTRAALLAHLNTDPSPLLVEAGPPAWSAAAVLADLPASDALDRFWLPPVPLDDRPVTALTVEPDLLLRQLPDPPARLGGRALADALRPLYRQAGRSADC